MWLRLDAQGPLYRQVDRALRAEILAGRLRPGTRLPATRVLARELGVSRNTVLQAYQQLLDEGYLEARTGSGTFVTQVLPEHRVEPPPAAPAPARQGAPAGAPRLSLRARRTLASVPERLAWGIPRRRLPFDFRYGEPAFGDLPLETWWRLQARRARRAAATQLGYGPPEGAPELRRALAGYLARARAVRCDPEQVLLVQGSQQAIDLTLRVLVDPGDRVAVEEPGYTGISLALLSHGAELVPVPVDDEGLRVDALPRDGTLRGLCATPSHQFPTGGLLSLARRLELLACAAAHEAFVLEDDYDGEFRYDGRPIESLQGLDEGRRVLYVGSTSKLLFPALRIAWLVVPELLVPAFRQAKALADTGSPTLDQLAFADFVEQGHLERHVRRSRARNAGRREALAGAVRRHLSGAARLAGTGAGLHGLIWLPGVPVEREAEVRRRCARAGVGIYPVLPFYRTPPAQAGFVLGFASLDEDAIEEGVRRFAEVVRAMGPAGVTLSSGARRPGSGGSARSRPRSGRR